MVLSTLLIFSQLTLNFTSLAQCYAVGLCLCFHQLQDEGSIVTFKTFISLTTGQVQFRYPSLLLLRVLAGVIFVDSWENWESTYLRTQQYHSWAYTEKFLNHTTRICSTMFRAALFIIAITWKQSRCPSTEEWIMKMWHIYTLEYYSLVKKQWHLEIYMQVDRTRKKKTSWAR